MKWLSFQINIVIKLKSFLYFNRFFFIIKFNSFYLNSFYPKWRTKHFKCIWEWFCLLRMEIYWLLDFWLHQPYRMSCITCIPTCMVVEKWWNRRFSLGPYALNSLIGTWSASKKDHINIWSYILTQLSISYPTFNFFTIGKICSKER